MELLLSKAISSLLVIKMISNNQLNSELYEMIRGGGGGSVRSTVQEEKLALPSTRFQNGTAPCVSQRGRRCASQLRVSRENTVPWNGCEPVTVCVAAGSPIQPTARGFRSTRSDGDLPSRLPGRRSAPSALLRRCDFARTGTRRRWAAMRGEEAHYCDREKDERIKNE